MMPCFTRPGIVKPMGPLHAKVSAMVFATRATSGGRAGRGVAKRMRASVSVPKVVSTGAPLMPLSADVYAEDDHVNKG